MPDDTTASDAMSDRELDELIAERVFGWTRWEGPTGHKCFGPSGGGNQGCPFFSTEIDAAWLVLEHFSGPVRDRRAVVVSRTEEDGLWCCSIGLPDDVDATYEAAAVDSTAPRAICLAALKALSGVPHAR